MGARPEQTLERRNASRHGSGHIWRTKRGLGRGDRLGNKEGEMWRIQGKKTHLTPASQCIFSGLLLLPTWMPTTPSPKACPPLLPKSPARPPNHDCHNCPARRSMASLHHVCEHMYCHLCLPCVRADAHAQLMVAAAVVRGTEWPKWKEGNGSTGER